MFADVTGSTLARDPQSAVDTLTVFWTLSLVLTTMMNQIVGAVSLPARPHLLQCLVYASVTMYRPASGKTTHGSLLKYDFSLPATLSGHHL